MNSHQQPLRRLLQNPAYRSSDSFFNHLSASLVLSKRRAVSAAFSSHPSNKPSTPILSAYALTKGPDNALFIWHNHQSA